jgi:hypothetical protein
MSEDVSELTAKIDARLKSSQGDCMEYRPVVVHNGRRSKCWIRYSVQRDGAAPPANQIRHPDVVVHRNSYDSILFLAPLSFASQQPKAACFAVQLPKSASRISDRNKYFFDVLKRRPEFGDRGNKKHLDAFLFEQENIDIAQEEKERREAEEKARREEEDRVYEGRV